MWQYSYDAWGNLLTATGTEAAINPIRYRGYYFDTETGLYYVSSRYYDSEVERFISPDTTDILTATLDHLTDKNLFAYCDNNPTMRVDYGGEFWSEIGLAIAVVSSVVAIGALVVATCGVASVALISGGSAIVATSSAATAFEVATIASATAIGGAALYAVSETENSIMNAKSKSLSGRPELKKQGREGLEKRKTQKIGRKGLEKNPELNHLVKKGIDNIRSGWLYEKVMELFKIR